MEGPAACLLPLSGVGLQHVLSPCFVPSSMPSTGDTEATGQSPAHRSSQSGEEAVKLNSDHEGGRQRCAGRSGLLEEVTSSAPSS